jgi:arylsulfatase A-like enzyme
MQTHSLSLASVVVVGSMVLVGCGDRSVGLEEHSGDLVATRMVYDLAERAAAAEVVHSAPFIDVGSAGSTDALVSGWSSPEIDSVSARDFAWAVADRAVLETDLLDTDPSNLDLRCRSFTWDGAPEQRLRVTINGREVGDVVLAPEYRDYSFVLPKGTTAVGVNRVEFGFSWTAAPADRLPGNQDRRTLAAAFDWVRFGPPSATESGSSAPSEPAVAGTELLVPSGTGLRYRLTVPEDAVLDFGVSRPPTAPGVGGLVWLTRPGETVSRSVVVDPAEVAGDRVRFEIGPAGGGVIELGIATTGHGRNDAVLTFQSPRILGLDDGGEEIANVVLIVVDTLRADFLGVYGADGSTPIIDGLAEEGVLFTRARSHIPITGPSHASLFTSRLPMEHGVINNAQELSDGFLTLAESMQSAGRRTAAVISLGVMQRQFGFDRGFDRYGDDFPRDWMKNATEVTDEALALADGSLANPYLLWAHYSDPHEPYAPPNLDYPRIELRLDGQPFGVIDAGGRGNRFDLELPPGASEVEFVPLDVEPGRSYRFDTLRIDDPAIELEPLGGWVLREKRIGPPTYQSTLPATLRLTNHSDEPDSTGLLITCKQLLEISEIRQRYAQEVEYVDGEIGRLLAGLQERGLMDNTLVVFASDHGEGLGYHNHTGHVSQLYDTLVHVPLIFVWPDKLPRGLVVEEPVSLVDVFPTVADLLGLARPEAASGISLTPLFRGEEIPGRATLLATYPPESASSKRAIVLDGHKFIHSWNAKRDWVELYDVVNDPGELEDLAQTHTEILERLREELQRRLAELSEGSTIEAELSEEDKAQLRALGYLH